MTRIKSHGKQAHIVGRIRSNVPAITMPPGGRCPTCMASMRTGLDWQLHTSGSGECIIQVRHDRISERGLY